MHLKVVKKIILAINIVRGCGSMKIGVDCDGVLTVYMSKYIFEYGEIWFKKKTG